MVLLQKQYHCRVNGKTVSLKTASALFLSYNVKIQKASIEAFCYKIDDLFI